MKPASLPLYLLPVNPLTIRQPRPTIILRSSRPKSDRRGTLRHQFAVFVAPRNGTTEYPCARNKIWHSGHIQVCTGPRVPSKMTSSAGSLQRQAGSLGSRLVSQGITRMPLLTPHTIELNPCGFIDAIHRIFKNRRVSSDLLSLARSFSVGWLLGGQHRVNAQIGRSQTSARPVPCCHLTQEAHKYADPIE